MNRLSWWLPTLVALGVLPFVGVAVVSIWYVLGWVM